MVIGITSLLINFQVYFLWDQQVSTPTNHRRSAFEHFFHTIPGEMPRDLFKLRSETFVWSQKSGDGMNLQLESMRHGIPISLFFSRFPAKALSVRDHVEWPDPFLVELWLRGKQKRVRVFPDLEWPPYEEDEDEGSWENQLDRWVRWVMIISYNNKPFVQFFVLEDGGWLLASCFRFFGKVS